MYDIRCTKYERFLLNEKKGTPQYKTRKLPIFTIFYIICLLLHEYL
jgi:hypothetical protein